MDDAQTVGRAGLRRRHRPAGGNVPQAGDVPRPRGGDEPTVRGVDTREFEAVADMHRRCSPRTLADRYGASATDPDGLVRHLLAPRFGRSLAAWSSSGELVAVGHLLWDGDEAEAALLVEDSWQRRGLGTGLLRRLVHLAGELGHGSVYAVARPPGTAGYAVMRRLGLPLEVRHEEDAVVLSARPVPVPRHGPRRATRRCDRR